MNCEIIDCYFNVFFIKIRVKKVNLKSIFQSKFWTPQCKFLKGHSQVWDNFWQLKVRYKLMKNAFHFTLKALFTIIKIFKILSWLFGHAEKWLDQKDTFNFKVYDITAWLTNNYNTHWPISAEAKAIWQWNLVS